MSDLRNAWQLIDAIVRHDVQHGFPSAQIAVMQDGKLLYENAWGKGITCDTLFDLASNTKVYSVVYALQHLVSEGRIDVDSTVCSILGDDFASAVLPLQYSEDTPGIEIQRSEKKRVTLRHLLTHTAGMPAEARFLFEKDYRFYGIDGNPLFIGCDASPETRSRVWDALCRMPLAQAPETALKYSDVDFILLCFVVEKVTGQRIDAYLKDTFFTPLSLSRITYRPLDNGFLRSDCAPTELHGNTRDGLRYFNGIRTETICSEVHDETAWYAMAGISGHAGLFANARDLARLADLMIHSDGFFTEAVIDRFTAPCSENHDDWGLGWYRQGNHKRSTYFGDLCPEDTIGHQGWTGTLTVIDRTNRLVIAVLTSKRNTPLSDPSEDAHANIFDGGYYTTAQLGFVSRIVYDALYGQGFSATLDHLEQELIDQANGCPYPAAQTALLAFREARTEYENRI